MKLHALTGSILLLTTLTGCMLGPNYERPGGLTPDSFRGVESGTLVTSRTTTFADLPWWQIYRDPQLQELIRTALAENPDLLLMAARVEEAQANLGIVSADLWPQVGAQASASRTRTPEAMRQMVVPAAPDGVFAPSRNNLFTATLYSTYELDLWGRIRRNREAATRQLEATEAEREAVVSGLITEVVRSYYTLLELDREMEITSATLQARLKTLELMEARRRHNIASNLEVSRYEAEVAATRAQQAELYQQIFQVENALSVLIGRSPQEIRRGLDFNLQPEPPDVPVGLPAAVLDRRPDLRAAEKQLEAATANIGAAKAAFFPSISLTGEAGFRSTALGDLLEADSFGWSIAGNVVQSVFDGGRRWYNLRATRARQEQALQNYRSVILNALREVSDALVARRQKHEQRLELIAQADALREAVRLVTLRFDAGQSSYLELLNAQQQLYAAEVRVERARLEEMLATVRLYKALGGGVVERPADQTAAAATAP